MKAESTPNGEPVAVSSSQAERNAAIAETHYAYARDAFGTARFLGIAAIIVGGIILDVTMSGGVVSTLFAGATKEAIVAWALSGKAHSTLLFFVAVSIIKLIDGFVSLQKGASARKA